MSDFVKALLRDPNSDSVTALVKGQWMESG